MLHGIVAASFKNIVESYDVTLYVNIRILNTIAYTRLSSQIHNYIKLIFRKQAVYQFTVGYATLHEMIAYRWLLTVYLVEFTKAILLQGRIIVGVQVVNTHNGAFCHVLEQTLNQIGSNKTGRTSNKYCFHLLFIVFL